MEKVILVDKNDKQVGVAEKIEAHKKALLHRAVSILIFNGNGEFLLQKRAKKKYHSGGLWSNTVCTHPIPGETNLSAANRRLFEEMRLKANLEKKFFFIYKSELDNNFFEYELDHVFFGITDKRPNLNLAEAEDFRYISYENLIFETEVSPHKFTSWFKIILKHAKKIFPDYCCK